MSTTISFHPDVDGIYLVRSMQLPGAFNVEIAADGVEVDMYFVDQDAAIAFARDLLSKVMPDTLDEALEDERTACEKATTAEEFLDAYGRDTPL